MLRRALFRRLSFRALVVGVIFGYCLVFLLQGSSVFTLPHRNIRSIPLNNSLVFGGNESDDQEGGAAEDSIHSNKLFTEIRYQTEEDSNSLFNKVRVLCWIMTSPGNHKTRAMAVKKTWGKRCNILLFMSSEEDSSLPTVKLPVNEGRNQLWGKTREAFRYIWNNYRDQADWFFKADDDTYAILENMRYFLSAYNTSRPLWFGSKFRTIVKQGYFSGGAGYVLSKEATKRFVEQGYFNALLCRHDHEGAEDAEMGKCMSKLNISSMDTRDSKGRGRFFPFVPDQHLFPGKVDKNYWYWNAIYYPVKEGLECCSDSAISFHYITTNQMYLLEYFIYQLRPFGLEPERRPPTPEPPPDLDLTAIPWSVPVDDNSTQTTPLPISTATISERVVNKTETRAIRGKVINKTDPKLLWSMRIIPHLEKIMNTLGGIQ